MATEGPIGPSWTPLGPSWDPLVGLLGRLGAILGASWAVLDAVKAPKANIVKMYVFRKDWGDFCPFGALLGCSWGSLEASWGPLVPSWASHGGLVGLLASLRARLRPSSPTSRLKYPLPEAENGPRAPRAKVGTRGGSFEKILSVNLLHFVFEFLMVRSLTTLVVVQQ